MNRREAIAALVAFPAVMFAIGCHDIQPNQLPSAPTPVVLVAEKILITIDPGELPPGGGQAIVKVEMRALDGRVVRDVPMILTVDGGSLTRSAMVSDNTGHAFTLWEGTASATVRVVSATAKNEAFIKVNR